MITTYPPLPPEATWTGVQRAVNAAYRTYGDVISIGEKGKQLNKFGRTSTNTAGASTTVSIFQGAVANETFATTNSIDSMVSDSAADTMSIGGEGHTIDGSGNLTFIAEANTLNGQTPVTLSTARGRASRAFIPNSGTFGTTPSAPAGNVYFYDSTVAGGVTGGVPNNAAATKLILPAGLFRSQKGATSTSSLDYWIITGMRASVDRSGPAAAVFFDIETRDIADGGPWVPYGLQVRLNTSSLETDFVDLSETPILVPKNHDARVVCTSDTNNTISEAALRGWLAKVKNP